ncbi:MAG: hypothetical protein WD045_13280 [Pirellulaceae bacterium]
MFSWKIFAAATVACGLILASGANAEDSPVFRAGAYVMDVTPEKLPISSAGSMGPRHLDKVHDRLNARCLVLDNGNTKLAIAVVDSCMIPRDIFDAAKEIASQETGIPVSHMLCAATHTHSAVTVSPVFQSEIDEDYCEFLTQRLAQGIIEAHARRQPARIGWAVGNNPRQVFNRRWHMRRDYALPNPFGGTDYIKMNPPRASDKLAQPVGPIDPEVSVLAVQTVEGKPLCLLANYSLHYVGGTPGGALSADYFGEFARQIGAKLEVNPQEDGFVGIMSNGTSGDINNVDFFEGAPGRQPFEQIRLVAEDVASSAKNAYDRIEFHTWVPLAMAEAEVELGVRKPTADEVAKARQVLEKLGEGPYRDIVGIYAHETIDMDAYPETVQAKLQALRIGELGIVSSPCETFVETGLAIKRDSPLKPTFTIELANGYNGYLPTARQHQLGGYETWRAKSSYLASDAEEQVRSILLKLLTQVAE